MDTETAFPLTWPARQARTPRQKRQTDAPFSKVEHVTGADLVKRSRDKAVSISVAIERLQQQLDMLGAQLPVLSSNLELRLNGLPRSGQTEPDDVGVACYFNLRDRRMVIACDRWVRTADNIAAIAAHIRATRSVERYGCGSVEQAFTGYLKLPAPGDINWRTILGVPEGFAPDLDWIENRRRTLAKWHHPDVESGSTEQMTEINRAADEARKELTA
jgi:hypothetical protein